MKNILLYKNSDKGFQAVKSGFSWPAFFFMLIWAFTKRLFPVGLLMFFVWLVIVGIYLIMMIEAMDHPDAIYVILLFFYAVAMGIYGNKWLSKSLEKRGYKLVQTVQAPSPRVAVKEAAAEARA